MVPPEMLLPIIPQGLTIVPPKRSLSTPMLMVPPEMLLLMPEFCPPLCRLMRRNVRPAGSTADGGVPAVGTTLGTTIAEATAEGTAGGTAEDRDANSEAKLKDF